MRSTPTEKKKYSKKEYSLQVDPFQKGAKTILKKSGLPCKIIKFSTIKWINIYYFAWCNRFRLNAKYFNTPNCVNQKIWTFDQIN